MRLPLLFLMLLACGCYKMPGDDDYSTVPATNNPSITCEKSGGGILPSVGY